jgi:hypothetical protein
MIMSFPEIITYIILNIVVITIFKPNCCQIDTIFQLLKIKFQNNEKSNLRVKLIQAYN